MTIENEDTWFDRTVCPDPCGMMHTRNTAGEALDGCPHETMPPVCDLGQLIRNEGAEDWERFQRSGIHSIWEVGRAWGAMGAMARAADLVEAAQYEAGMKAPLPEEVAEELTRRMDEGSIPVRKITVPAGESAWIVVTEFPNGSSLFMPHARIVEEPDLDTMESATGVRSFTVSTDLSSEVRETLFPDVVVMPVDEILEAWAVMGKRIRKVRKHRGISQISMTENLSMTRKEYRSVEQGGFIVTWMLIKDIARLLHVSPARLAPEFYALSNPDEMPNPPGSVV